MISPLTAETTNDLPERGSALSTLGPVSKPISNTRLTLKYLSWRTRKDTVTFWSSSICYKQTKNLSELLGQKPNIPVPKVLIAWTGKKGNTHLIMERIKGKELGLLWVKYGTKEKKAMANELKDYRRAVWSHQALQPGSWLS